MKKLKMRTLIHEGAEQSRNRPQWDKPRAVTGGGRKTRRHPGRRCDMTIGGAKARGRLASVPVGFGACEWLRCLWRKTPSMPAAVRHDRWGRQG